MEDKRIQFLMLDLIRLAVFDDAVSFEGVTFDEKTLQELYACSKRQELRQIVCYALEKLGVLGDDKLSETFRNASYFAVMRVEKAEHLFSRSNEIFEKNGIDYLPLKGELIRRFYPLPYFRTSNDTDVLIRNEDVKRAEKLIVTELKMKIGYRTSHDVVLVNDVLGHLEIHYSLLEKDYAERAAAVLSEVWERSVNTGGRRYDMPAELFMFYQVVHMMKHVAFGGCGVRSFIDLKLLLEKVEFDGEKLDALLTEGGVDKFFEGAKKLIGYWFEGASADEQTLIFSDYILGAGVFGSVENMVTVMEIKRGGRLKYLLNRVFLPYERLKGEYPSLEGKKYLTFLYQVRRVFRMLFSGKAKAKAFELKKSGEVTPEKKQLTEKLLEDLGMI